MSNEEITAFGDKLVEEKNGVMIFILTEDGAVEGHFFNVNTTQIRQVCCLGIHRACVRDEMEDAQEAIEKSGSKVIQ